MFAKLVYNIHWFIILYAGYNLYNLFEAKTEELKGLQSQIPSIQATIKTKKKELTKLLAYQEQINQKKKELELASEEIAKIQKKFPSEVNDPENLAMIKDVSDSLNIKDPGLSTLKEENKGFYFIKKYKFQAKATFLQFLILFEKISENERLFNINEVMLSEGKDKQKGRFKTVDGEFFIESYRYNASYKDTLQVSKKPTTKKGSSKKTKKEKKKGKKSKKGSEE